MFQNVIETWICSPSRKEENSATVYFAHPNFIHRVSKDDTTLKSSDRVDGQQAHSSHLAHQPIHVGGENFEAIVDRCQLKQLLPPLKKLVTQ